MNAAKLQHDIVLVGSVAELKVFDRGHADATAKVEDKGAQLYIPPGRSILQRQQAKVFSLWRTRLGINFVLVPVMRFLRSPGASFTPILTRRLGVEILQTLYELAKGGQHTSLLGLIFHAFQVEPPTRSGSPVYRNLGYANVHDARATSE